MAFENRARVRGFALLAIAAVAALLALTLLGQPNPKWILGLIARPQSQGPRLLRRTIPYAVQGMEEVEENDLSKFSVATTFSERIECLPENQTFSNARLVIYSPCMFNTGDLNVTNSTIVFNGQVQFFSTKQYIYMSTDSKWTFTNVTQIMVFTYWMGTGTFEFGVNSSLTITSSNTLTILCNSIFKGTVTVGNTRTKLLINGPSLNTGTINLVDRTSEYVCQTYPWLGRCILDGATVVSQATDLTGWRIAQQLECRGGIMEVNNCTISSQTTLPFELLMLSTPQWSMLDLNNITRAALFCGTKFSPTAFSDTTAFFVDTTCTYWGNSSWSNVASPFEPSDGFVIDYGNLVFANVTKQSKGLLITNGNFHIDGTSFYIDVKATGTDSWSIPLMEYNMTSCKTDWDDFITIHNCPSYSTCHWSAGTLPDGTCVVYFHYNDWYESNESLWWLLFLVLVPVLCVCWVCCCWSRSYKRKQETKLREEPAPEAELAYGRENLAGRAVQDFPALHQIEELRRPSDFLRPTTSVSALPAPAATPTSRTATAEMSSDSVFAPPRQQTQQKGNNLKV
eukprot:GGOE01006358.1.p1 GENE.GGOE01006358.1~~GGOE01006358.1.p1  ORF type:complete len:568 (+),score=166.11 GGOE01006358.1:47-1750(+)